LYYNSAQYKHYDMIENLFYISMYITLSLCAIAGLGAAIWGALTNCFGCCNKKDAKDSDNSLG